MLRLIESRGDWSGLRVLLQGVIDDDTIIAVKVIDLTDNTPISWAMTDSQLEDVKRILEKLIRR